MCILMPPILNDCDQYFSWVVDEDIMTDLTIKSYPLWYDPDSILAAERGSIWAFRNSKIHFENSSWSYKKRSKVSKDVHIKGEANLFVQKRTGINPEYKILRLYFTQSNRTIAFCMVYFKRETKFMGKLRWKSYVCIN